MPDERSRSKAQHRRDWLPSPSRRMRLYTDEDLPPRAIELLSLGANVLTTKQAGRCGPDDVSQVAFAATRRRVLVTRNGKHFLDERLIPLSSTRGVIAIEMNDRSEDSCLAATAIITEYIVPYAELYENMKIRISSSGGSFRFIDRSGRRRAVTLTLEQLDAGRYPTDEDEDSSGVT